MVMDLNSGSIFIGLFAGTIGAGMVMYGKKAGRLIPMVSGAGLIAIPCFISSTPILLISCVALAAAPWIVHEG